MSNLTIRIRPIKQKGNEYYIGIIKARDLITLATVNIRGKESESDNYLKEVRKKMESPLNLQMTEKGIQRTAEKKRLEKIGEYINREDALFPGNIIISVHHKDKDIEPGYELQPLPNGDFDLTINSDKANVFVIDGQHRLGGFAYADPDKIEEYELSVAIFFELIFPIQADLFATINGTQKPVSKSLLYDLLDFEPEELDSLAQCHFIAKWFHIDPDSPLKGKIKMVGIGKGSISQSAFVDALYEYLRDRKVAKYKSILIGKGNDQIIKILRSYFLGIKKAFKNQWISPDDYNLLNTTGFGAFMKAFYYIYTDCEMNDKAFRSDVLVIGFENVQKAVSFSKAENKGVAGQGSQKALMQKIVVSYFNDYLPENKDIIIAEFEDIEKRINAYYA